MTRSSVWRADNIGSGIMSSTPVSVANVAIRTTSQSSTVVQPASVISHSITQVTPITQMDHRNAGDMTESHESISQHAFENLAFVIVLYLTNEMTIDSSDLWNSQTVTGTPREKRSLLPIVRSIPWQRWLSRLGHWDGQA